MAITEEEADMAVEEAVTVEDTEADMVRKRTMAVFALEKTMETTSNKRFLAGGGGGGNWSGHRGRGRGGYQQRY